MTPEALRILRHITLPTDGRPYLQYIADLGATGDREAIEVKLADNLDATEYHSTRATAESRAIMAETYDPVAPHAAGRADRHDQINHLGGCDPLWDCTTPSESLTSLAGGAIPKRIAPYVSLIERSIRSFSHG